MPRALWSGTINFGLVQIPVRLLPATRKLDVRFREIDRATRQRVHHQRVVDYLGSASGSAIFDGGNPGFAGRSDIRPVADGIVKGYEVAPGSYVTLEPEEIEELRPEPTKTIDIQEFVPAAEIDPVHFDTAYQVVAQRDFERPFALLVAALEASERLAIAWIVLRKIRHLAAIRPYRGLLLLTTLYFADEVLEPARTPPSEQPGEKELKMAGLLIDQLAASFDPARYEDDYRRRVQELIASRLGEARAVEQPPELPTSGGVTELMAALEASLAKIRQERKTG